MIACWVNEMGMLRHYPITPDEVTGEAKRHAAEQMLVSEPMMLCRKIVLTQDEIPGVMAGAYMVYCKRVADFDDRTNSVVRRLHHSHPLVWDEPFYGCIAGPVALVPLKQ